VIHPILPTAEGDAECILNDFKPVFPYVGGYGCLALSEKGSFGLDNLKFKFVEKVANEIVGLTINYKVTHKDVDGEIEPIPDKETFYYPKVCDVLRFC